MIVTDETKIKCLRMEKEGIPRKEIHQFYIKTTGSTSFLSSFERTLRRWIVEYKDIDLTIEETNRLWLLPEEDKPANRVVGVIPDYHAPFHHPSARQFLLDTFIEWEVTDIVFVGDLVDNHAISRHESNPEALGGKSEFKLAYEEVQELIELFPIAKFCLGNHDKIPQRQAATLGLHTGFLKSFSEIWNLPNTWEVDLKHIIDNVLYTHGIGANGKNGDINLALKNRMSVVKGHDHTNIGIRYSANERDLIFGMTVGTLVDNEAYAFEYGKFFVNKPILSCGIVKSNKEAYIIPMTTKHFRKDN